MNQILACFILFFSATGYSFDRWTHFGLRPLAMGNAFTAVSDDYNAIFYNPAGLAKIKSWDLELTNPNFSFSEDSRVLAREIIGLATGSESFSNTSEILDFMESKLSTEQYVSIGFTPYFIKQGLGLGFGALLQAGLSFNRYPSVNLEAGVKSISPVSYARSFLKDKLMLGASVKFRTVTEVARDLSLDDLDTLRSSNNNGEKQTKSVKDFAKAGYGVGFDMGLLYNSDLFFKPSLGFSVLDIATTSYSSFKVLEDKASRASSEPMTVNMGLSLTPWQFRNQHLLVAMDFQEINHPIASSNKIQLGTEYSYGNLFKAELGLYKLGLTAGLQLDLWLFNLRLATYEEPLTYSAYNESIRIYSVQMKLLI